MISLYAIFSKLAWHSQVTTQDVIYPNYNSTQSNKFLILLKDKVLFIPDLFFLYLALSRMFQMKY